MSRRTAVAGTPFLVEGGIVVKANPLSVVDERYRRDGLFIQYASMAVDAYGFSLDEDGRLAVAFTDALTSGRVLGLYWSESDSAYVLNLYDTIVAQFTATRILCDDIFAGSGDFDFVRINAGSGPAAGIPGSGECVVYVQSSGGVDYLRVKFNSGAVREIANSSQNLVQFDGIGVNGGIPSAGEIAFDTAGTIYSGGGLLTGNLTLACRGVSGDIILSPAGQAEVDGVLVTGGATHYTQFDATGHQTMAGSAKPWDDLRVEPVARTTGANAPAFEKWLDDSGGTSRGVYLYSFDDAVGGSEKEVFFSMQMPHGWDGGEIHLHVHWIGAVDDTTAAPRWGLEYAWKDVGQVFGDTTIVYSDGSNYTETGTDADVTALKHYISKFSALTPGTSADGISSVLIGRLFRDSADAGDTYNAAGAKCGLLYIDAHYQLARIGSTDEYTA